ncbi:hypothetical protein Tco_0892597 [Tanacetum coccineum]|uniref:Uncharacterized protein n=1 Tax=Tanacetum coccineum TaxID=301880 RepID=A0ABQ5C6D5_9ASTR
MSEKEDTYHDTILDLEAKLKKNVDLILKLGNSLQGMFMLGPKPLSVYDQQLKHGLGYLNPYTLKQAISKCPKLYVASSLGNLEIPLNVRDSEDTLEDAFKSQQKMTEKMNDPIAVANKQNCWTINYKKLNALYKDFVPQKELSVEQKYFPSSSIPSVKIPVSKNMPSESPLIKELDKIKVCFEKLDIKEMKDVFESTESELDELEKQNDLLKDQLLEASLKHDVELCVLLNHECVDKILSDELDQVKKKSFEIQEGLQSRIKILEKDVQRCQKQSVDFELKLQHEKEKHKWDSTSRNKNTNPLDYSWISKLEKLENENVSLDFKVQSLIKERDNVKIEYQKLFDSIKKTRSQTQKEMDELIVHVSEKTYAYGAIRAENQDLLSTISELKTRLEKVEKEGDDFDHLWLRFLICILSAISDMAAFVTVVKMSKSNFNKSHVFMAPMTVGHILILVPLNDLTDLTWWGDGLPKFKYGKDHLCSAYEKAKNKKASHPPKLVSSDYSKLELLHMDLCGPMRVASINGKKYILVILAFFDFITEDQTDYEKTICQFDELTAMASEHDCLEPELQRFNNYNSSAEPMNNPSKEDLDNLFGPMFEEYYEQKSSDTPIYSAAQPTQVHEDSPSTSSIIVDEQTSPISLTEADEFDQEDTADFDGNAQFVPYNPPSHEEIESSTTALEPSKDSEVCMYALTVSTIEPKNIKEAMADHKGMNMIALNGIWKNRVGCVAENIVNLRFFLGTSPSSSISRGIFIYADHAGCKDDCKSTSGGLQFRWKARELGCSKKQIVLDLSSAEIIIMVQQQHAADVHPDELCPPNKRYDLMDANKKVDLDHVQCPSESKILTNIIKNHPLRYGTVLAYFEGRRIKVSAQVYAGQERTHSLHWMTSDKSFIFHKQLPTIIKFMHDTTSFLNGSILQASIGIYKGVKVHNRISTTDGLLQP